MEDIYWTARVWMDKSDVRVSLQEMRAYFDKPYSAPPAAIRVIGASPYLAMSTMFILHLIVFGIPFFSLLDGGFFFSKLMFGGFILGLGGGISPSDVLAMTFPEKYQGYAEGLNEGDEQGALSILFTSLR